MKTQKKPDAFIDVFKEYVKVTNNNKLILKIFDQIVIPLVSCFGGGNREKKKQRIIKKLKRFFERFFGIGGSTEA